MPLFGGRGHGLLSVEWQDQSAIRNCAAARDWCAESRSMFSNNSNFNPQPDDPINPRPGFEDYPARFELQRRQARGEIATGLLYVDPEPVDLHAHLRTVEAPLNSLGMADLSPGAAALAAVNASLR